MTPTSALNSVFSHPASRFRERTISMATRAQATCWSSSYPTAWAHPIRHPLQSPRELRSAGHSHWRCFLNCIWVCKLQAGKLPCWNSGSWVSFIFLQSNFHIFIFDSFIFLIEVYHVKCMNIKWNFYICTCLTTTQTKMYSASPQVLSYSLQVISPKGNLT